MADIIVSITKSTIFKSGREEFSNAYRYTGVSTEASAIRALTDAVVLAERLIHSSLVDFHKVQAWDAGVPPNFMRESRELTGSGSAPNNANMYKECAILMTWPLPRKFGLRRSSHRALRKFLHTSSTPPGLTPGGDGQASPIVTGSIWDQYRINVRQPVAGVELCAPDGTVPTGPGQLHPYMEHRQFPRGRKRKASIL